MSLEQKVMTDLKAAMLAKDEAALRSLRAIKAAIILAKTAEGASGDLKEEDEVKLFRNCLNPEKIHWKYIKTRTARSCDKGRRRNCHH